MITVWGRNNSTNVKKVLWCLAELHLDCHAIPAGGAFGITHEAKYLAMNPNGLVPCIHDNAHNLTLWESNTIVRYLAAEYGKGSLWTDAPAVRAVGEKWMDWSATALAPPHGGVFLSLIRTAPEKRNAKLIEQSIEKCNDLMAMLDAELAEKTWLGGEHFGVGDIAVAPLIYNLFNLDVTWNETPHLRRWYQQLTERPAFQKHVMIPLS